MIKPSLDKIQTTNKTPTDTKADTHKVYKINNIQSFQFFLFNFLYLLCTIKATIEPVADVIINK